jgi:hypothetical protein
VRRPYLTFYDGLYERERGRGLEKGCNFGPGECLCGVFGARKEVFEVFEEGGDTFEEGVEFALVVERPGCPL